MCQYDTETYYICKTSPAHYCSNTCVTLWWVKHIACYCVCTGWVWEQCWLEFIQWLCVYCTVFTCMLHYQSSVLLDLILCIVWEYIELQVFQWDGMFHWLGSTKVSVSNLTVWWGLLQVDCFLLMHHGIWCWLQIKTIDWFLIDMEKWLSNFNGRVLCVYNRKSFMGFPQLSYRAAPPNLTCA